MAIAAPIITQNMLKWISLGGRNSGIVGDSGHTSGFHRGANEVPPSDYSRRRDPNGSDGPFADWSYACAGDFRHDNNPKLIGLLADVLYKARGGHLPQICEWIGVLGVNGTVMYWSAWSGTLTPYTGSGHDQWTHISWYRSRVNYPTNLFGEANLMDAEDYLKLLKNPDIQAYFRSAPWNQEVGRTDVTTHDTLFGDMRVRLNGISRDSGLASIGVTRLHEKVDIQASKTDSLLTKVDGLAANIPYHIQVLLDQLISMQDQLERISGGGIDPTQLRAIIKEVLVEILREGVQND